MQFYWIQSWADIKRHLHEKLRSSQRKCRELLSNLPSHHDNATHQGILINQRCYKEKCMERTRSFSVLEIQCVLFFHFLESNPLILFVPKLLINFDHEIEIKNLGNLCLFSPSIPSMQ